MSCILVLVGIVSSGDFPIWTTLALGFVLGLRHALDADHLAAVSTFVSEEKNPWNASRIGISWGLGHTAALLVFGLAITAFRLAITPCVSQFLEFLVGCMLVYLGASVLLRLLEGPALHVHAHDHNGVAHTHLHFHLGAAEHAHQHRRVRLAGRPFTVGVMHGLAGTAAIMLLVAGRFRPCSWLSVTF